MLGILWWFPHAALFPKRKISGLPEGGAESAGGHVAGGSSEGLAG